MGLQLGLTPVTELLHGMPALELNPPLGLNLQPLPRGKQVRNLLELETTCSGGKQLAGTLQILCGEEDFLPLCHNQGKECQKAFGSQQITFRV